MYLHCPICGKVKYSDYHRILSIEKDKVVMRVDVCDSCSDELLDKFYDTVSVAACEVKKEDNE